MENDLNLAKLLAEEEATLAPITQNLRDETGALARQNATLAALLARRRGMVDELRRLAEDAQQGES